MHRYEVVPRTGEEGVLLGADTFDGATRLQERVEAGGGIAAIEDTRERGREVRATLRIDGEFYTGIGGTQEEAEDHARAQAAVMASAAATLDSYRESGGGTAGNWE